MSGRSVTATPRLTHPPGSVGLCISPQTRGQWSAARGGNHSRRVPRSLRSVFPPRDSRAVSATGWHGVRRFPAPVALGATSSAGASPARFARGPTGGPCAGSPPLSRGWRHAQAQAASQGSPGRTRVRRVTCRVFSVSCVAHRKASNLVRGFGVCRRLRRSRLSSSYVLILRLPLQMPSHRGRDGVSMTSSRFPWTPSHGESTESPRCPFEPGRG